MRPLVVPWVDNGDIEGATIDYQRIYKFMDDLILYVKDNWGSKLITLIVRTDGGKLNEIHTF